MDILVSGASGFLGQYVIRELLGQGHQIFALVRDPRKRPQGCIPLQGDVTKGNLGLIEVPELEELWNMAGVINLSKKAKKENFEVNAEGALNVVNFALAHNVKRVIHVSTAYVDTRRNPYEESKFWGEQYIIELSQGMNFHEPVPTIIFKPSILVGEYETGAIPDGIKAGAFYEFVRRLLRIHARIERIRKGAEAKLHLPPWDFVFRIPGDPEATLNLMPVDIAAKEMARIAVENETGTFYITDPNPLKLRELAEWVGEAVRLKIRVEPGVMLLPWELAFASVAADFLAYLRSEPVWESAVTNCPEIDREYIKRTLAYLLQRGKGSSGGYMLASG